MSTSATQPVDVDVDMWSDTNLRDPFPIYAELRALAPVVRLVRHGAYAVTRYAEIRNMLQDWESFTSAKGVGMSEIANGRAGRGVISSDPPIHSSRRRVLNSQLLPPVLKPHEQFIETRAIEFADQAVDARDLEVVAELATPFSVSLVCDLVGLPEEGREQLLPWARLGFDSWGPPGTREEAATAGYQNLVNYSNTVAVPEHLAAERWGVEIYDAADRGDLEPEAIHGVVFAYLQAGMDTTVNAIGSALYLFAQHPDQWDHVRSDPELIPSAVNEVLRYYSPVQRYTRVTTRDTGLGGIDVPADSRVVALIGSGNRDERRFEEPDRFDVTRNPIDQLSFGRGIHHCAGAGLARLELSALLARFAERVERFEIRSHEWDVNATVHGLRQLDITIHPT
ncbi:MAG: cytochrome P450 [Actinomycetes bacterium]